MERTKGAADWLEQNDERGTSQQKADDAYGLVAEHQVSIRHVLTDIDPNTGYTS